MKIFLLGALLLHSANSVRFLAIGDYGDVNKPSHVNKIFDEMNDFAQLHSHEFIVTTGDNIYAKDQSKPTTAEMSTMLQWF
jgi:hypothetical protein